MTEKARLAKERILAGKKEMEAEKQTYHTWVEGDGIRLSQYQGYAKSAKGEEPVQPLTSLERAANYRVKGGRTKLDPEVAQIYSPK